MPVAKSTVLRSLRSNSLPKGRLGNGAKIEHETNYVPAQCVLGPPPALHSFRQTSSPLAMGTMIASTRWSARARSRTGWRVA